MTVAVVLAALVVRLPRLRAKPMPLPVEPTSVATLLEVAVASGQTVFDGLRTIAGHVGPEGEAEINTVLAQSRTVGLAGALAEAEGHLGPLLRPLASSVRTGAAVQPVLASLRRSVAASQAAELEARLERLPVKLAFPLALLMLPGMLLMIVAPSLVDVLSRLG